MSWNTRDIPDQRGRVAVVTGANAGIGYETARALAHRGARVILACRDPARGRSSAKRILAENPSGTAVFEPLDLGSLVSVGEFATRIRARLGSVDLLINNAGVMVPPRNLTADGFELQFGVNHLGHFALTGLLLTGLRNCPDTRVVTVSSIAHRMGRIDPASFTGLTRYAAFREYRQSKLANLIFAIELERRLRASPFEARSLAAHPGITSTSLVRHRQLFDGVWRLVGMPAARGALPTLFAATAPDAEGGAYYGPDGFFEMRGNPARSRVALRARDPEMALRLWSASEELTGVRFPF